MDGTDSDISGSAQPQSPAAVLLDLAQYTLEQLCGNGEFVLHRGHPARPGEGSRASILVLATVSERPSAACLARLEHEYALRGELASAYAARPLALTRAQGRTALALEDPGGIPLDQLLHGPMELTQCLRLAIGMTAALGHLHNRGLVHKDIKPANILVDDATGQVWLTGFGIASRLARERQSLEPPEFIAGTLPYMAPEQTGRMNRSIDSRSDLYALGVTLYQMLTGALPFNASDPMEWVHCHIARRPVPPGERVERIPAAVSAIVMKLLAKIAEERYQTAAGVAHDLQHCLAEWEAHGCVEAFLPGEHDTPDRLLIPEKLYGREREIETLLAAFDRVATGGAPELMLISGYSGIGKSSFVDELHKVLAPARGLFASGKFDQHRRDIPYSTLAQAFQSLVRVLLAKSEADLSPWRDALREALGPNGQLMVDLVPELKLIIGEQPPLPELALQHARGRFQLVLRRFIGVFARPGRALVLFLDDLQWVDAGTLDLLGDWSTQPEVQNLLLIGAYRDNEVESGHPLLRKLATIKHAGAKIEEIALAPLARQHIGRLLADALRSNLELTAPLAQLTHEKTAGNPFFVIQFLRALYEEALLTFDRDAARWSWDIERIRAKGYTDNVADLMVATSYRLPVQTKEAMSQLACLGNSTQIEILCLVCGATEQEVHTQLWEALRDELIVRSDGGYRFVHDRVREAAYSLVPPESRATAHVRIGRLLAAHTSAEKREEAIFEIVSQLNRGATLITSTEERNQLAAFNLLAGKRAKASTAYVSALNYLVTAAAFLTDDSWERRHELAFSIELNRAECEFLTGELTAAEPRLAALSARARNAIDQAAVACLRVDLYTALSQSDRAVAVGLGYLRQIGVQWSAHPADEEVRREYEQITSRLGSRPIEALLDLPLMSDPLALATLDVLTALLPPAFFTDANLRTLVMLRAVNLSLEWGNSDASCTPYVMLGMVAGARFGDYERGLQFSKLGKELVEHRGLKRFQARTYLNYGNVVMPWTKHFRAGREVLRQAFDIASNTGDVTFAAYTCSSLNANFLAAGDPLAEAQREAENGRRFAEKVRFGFVVDIITAELGLMRMLRGLTMRFGVFDDGQFDALAFERHLSANPALALPECWYWIRTLQARFFAGDYASALEAATKARRLRWAPPQLFETAEYEFYAALSRAACWDCASPGERDEHFEALSAHHGQLTTWAQNCPDNFENRAALVGAEMARIEGRDADAMRLYEQAIRSSRSSGFVHNEGLANEIAARFYSARGFGKIADAYLRDARHCYLRWGADGKVRQLERLYPQLKEQEPGPGAASTIQTPVEHLDLATVLKVSQAVSGEMVLGKLIDTLMRTALEHAGADRALLIVPRGEAHEIEAEATTGRDTVNVHQRGDSVEAALYPESVVHYVARTREGVVLDDASADSPFSADPYLAGRSTRSILCLPLISRARLIAVLYLENGLSPGVFTPTRGAVLKLLASQAAIALENAHLYTEARAAEQALRDSEEQWRAAFESNPTMYFMLDAQGTIVTVNAFGAQQLGYSLSELIGRPVLNVFHEADREVVRLHADACLATLGRTMRWEARKIRKDGTMLWVRETANGVLLRNQPVLLVVCEDITERKRAEEALRQSETYLAQAQRVSHTGSWVWNALMGTRFWSEECYRVLGFDPAQGVPAFESFLQRVHPDDRAGWQERLHKALRDQVDLESEYRITHPAGGIRHIYVVAHPVLDPAGESADLVGTVIDITERRRADQRLLAQHRVTQILAQAATLEEAAPRILQALCECLDWDVAELWRVDREAGVLRCVELWHTGALDMAQFEAATWASAYNPAVGLPGRVWSNRAPVCIPDCTEEPSFVRAAAATRAGLRAAFGFPILLAREVLGVIDLFSREVRAPDQDLLEAKATIGSQIGQFVERKRAEVALRDAQAELTHVTRVMIMGELAASIAHEVNQPLGAMVTSAASCSRWLALQPPDMEKAQRSLERIANDGRRAGEVISRIRSLMKRQAPQRSRVDLNEAILEVVALTRHEIGRHGIVLDARLAQGLPLVQADRVQLQQVMINLIMNAVEAMREVEDRPRQLTITSGRQGAQEVLIAVRDSGVGVDSASCDKLFDAFYTTKADGIGMGLSISRSIVEAHGGRLWAAANEPHGAAFHFSLPVEEAV